MLCYIIIGHFYSFDDGLFFLSANEPSDVSLKTSGTDFGHNAKANWMIRWTGLMTGNDDLVAFAENNAKAIFERAYLNDNGSWAQALNAGGSLDIDKSWWIFAELDQLAGTLALRDPSYARYLDGPYTYWLKYFVDKQYGEVWNGVDGKTNLPQRSLPKQWQWKVAYHSFEHALVNYIVNQQLSGDSVTLYYAFPDSPGDGTVRPYYFYGDVQETEFSTGVWRVVFSNVH
jgi:hypothetical protein